MSEEEPSLKKCQYKEKTDVRSFSTSCAAEIVSTVFTLQIHCAHPATPACAVLTATLWFSNGLTVEGGEKAELKIKCIKYGTSRNDLPSSSSQS